MFVPVLSFLWSLDVTNSVTYHHYLMFKLLITNNSRGKLLGTLHYNYNSLQSSVMTLPVTCFLHPSLCANKAIVELNQCGRELPGNESEGKGGVEMNRLYTLNLEPISDLYMLNRLRIITECCRL